MQYSVLRIKQLGKKIIIILLFVFFLNTEYSILNTVSAQQVSLSISPPLIEILAKPGKSMLVRYTINNDGDPTVLTAKVTNFAPLGIYGQVQLVDELEGPVNFSLDNADYKLDKPFFIKNNKQIQLLLRIKIPPGAPNGDYYYNFNITSNPAGSIDQTSTSYTAATVGSNILITVTDSQNFQIVPQIADFIIVNGHKIKFAGNVINLFDSTDPIIVRLVLKNNGKLPITNIKLPLN